MKRSIRKVGFIGLGNVGANLASNLIKSGYSLIVHDMQKERVQLLVEKGALAANSAKEIGREADVIMLSLPHPRISEDVIMGKEGVLEGCSPGKIVIETSTISPTLAKKFGKECKSRGVDFVDAAIAGGLERARDGNLVFMIGGEDHVVKKVLGILETLGKELFHVGGIGTGMTVKVVNNAISHVTMVAIAEAISVGVKAGIDPNVLYEVLSNGSADSDILRRRYKGRVLKGNYDNGMAVNHAYKDSELICDFAKEMGVPVFIINSTHAVYEWAKAEGLGQLDYAAIIKLWERVLNVKITGTEKTI
jgi:3-hydroxyisobutyrate dehydrogenase-like beta-hydroxyacid dehydrogenase